MKPTVGPLPRGLDLTCQGRVDWAGPIQVLHRERGDPEERREEAAVPIPGHGVTACACPSHPERSPGNCIPTPTSFYGKVGVARASPGYNETNP